MPSPSLSPALGQESYSTSLWQLFSQSFDLFTVVLIIGSVVAVALIVRCALDVRTGRILPASSVRRAEDAVRTGSPSELRDFAKRDHSFLAPVIAACAERLDAPPEALREAAELAASEECARWFRKIEWLNLIGNLAPLVGLAGTVWGMIIAFSSLGATGGQAGPAELSDGISKALFHTLLGLCLAIPCLVVFGAYRARVDRICTRAMVVAGDLVDALEAQRSGRA